MGENIMKKVLRFLITIVILAVVIWLVVLAYRKYAGPKDRTVFRTEKLTKTDLTRTITATGTVEPEDLINVGAQVQGMITKFGTDADNKQVDYGSRVKAGSVLALIDDSLYAAELKSAAASQLQAKASINSAKALISQNRAKLLLTNQNFKRAEQLLRRKAMAQNEYDSVKAEFDMAKANQAVSMASLAQAEAQLAAANASYERAARNLSYCTIKSPVNGVIIDRRVNIGQTVVSSMTAPSLFLIAKDLKKMQVWVSVNEADVGQIRIGQPVTFTVDAFQNREFKGAVHKIRLNATMSSNVVTYVVEVETDNSDGTLLPYLTANVKFILASRQDVLAVSNAAFRFTPDAEIVPAEYKEALNVQLKRGQRQIWVADGKEIRPIIVQTGLNDGTMTEIISKELKEEMNVITGTEILTAAKQITSGNSGSPFLPKPPPRRKGKRK